MHDVQTKSKAAPPETALLFVCAYPCLWASFCFAARGFFAASIGRAACIAVVSFGLIRTVFCIGAFGIGFRCIALFVHVFFVAGAGFVVTALAVGAVGHS